MRKQLLLLLLLLIVQLPGIGQESKISISGNFTDEPFFTFAETVESQYDLTFFFHPGEVQNLKVNGNFNQASLSECLSEILEGTNLLFAIKNNQVFIYSGKALNPLFLEQ